MEVRVGELSVGRSAFEDESTVLVSTPCGYRIRLLTQ